MKAFRTTIAIAACVLTWVFAAPAVADIVLSQLIVELQPGQQDRQDLEVLNTGPGRAFVSITPKEVLNAGTPSETRIENPDPAKLGLLAAPARMVLEPGQRKLIRIAAIGQPDRERVYRVTVVPVAGEVSHDHAGLKLLVGYEVLVLVRPLNPKPAVLGERNVGQLIVRNSGNVSVELVDGKQCDVAGKVCSNLAGARLYAGAAKTIPLTEAGRVTYNMRIGSKLIAVQF